MTENLFKFNYSKDGVTGFVSLDRVDDEYVLSSDSYEKRSSDFGTLKDILLDLIVGRLIGGILAAQYITNRLKLEEVNEFIRNLQTD
jgi:hypothetical protein